jgi:hypothetical protein
LANGQYLKAISKRTGQECVWWRVSGRVRYRKEAEIKYLECAESDFLKWFDPIVEPKPESNRGAAAIQGGLF